VAEIIVREAAEDDVEALLSAYEWLFAPPGLPPPRWDPAWAADALRAAIGDADAQVLVAEGDGGGLAGLCTAYIDLDSVRYGRRCWVEDLAVDPDRRSQGVGKALLDAAKEWARGRGATHLELDSGMARTDAHRFYEREEPGWVSKCFAWEL
jgi:GNAT superfamily N-acetyltransferase